MDRAMADADPVFLATFGVTAGDLARRRPEVDADVPSGRILRSVLMKPEHEPWLDELHGRVETHARAVVSSA
jgi:hypothetical protein